MDSKIKHVKIKDGGHEKEFTIRLFGCLEGIDFIDRTLAGIAEKRIPSIKTLASDLLPLATYVGPDGKPIDTLSIEKADSLFENPLSALELAINILEHQMVFMNESEVFRPFVKQAKNIFNIPTSDSTTQSETSSIQK